MQTEFEYDYMDYRFVGKIMPEGDDRFMARMLIRSLGVREMRDVECAAPAPFSDDRDAREWAIEFGKGWVDENG